MAAKKNKKGVIEDAADFIVAQPIKHNGEDYQVGEIITLTEKDGVPLLELGVIKVDNEDWGDGELSIETKTEIDESNPETKAEIDAETDAGVIEIDAEIEAQVKAQIEAA